MNFGPGFESQSAYHFRNPLSPNREAGFVCQQIFVGLLFVFEGEPVGLFSGQRRNSNVGASIALGLFLIWFVPLSFQRDTLWNRGD